MPVFTPIPSINSHNLTFYPLDPEGLLPLTPSEAPAYTEPGTDQSEVRSHRFYPIERDASEEAARHTALHRPDYMRFL